jgi:hypothetical protein
METLKSLSEEFQDLHDTIIFSPSPGKLMDVVSHLTESQISYQLTFIKEDQ